MNEPTLTAADLNYIHRDYVTLEAICAARAEKPDQVRALIAAGQLPQPSYVLDDGTEMVPPDYFRLPDEAGGPDNLRAHFSERYHAAGGKPEDFAEEWKGYISGVYGVCLKELVPEMVVRKTELVNSLTALLDDPRPEKEEWRERLRVQVDELDAIERDFSPNYDRSERFDQPPSRDRLIVTARKNYPDVFALRA